jgi:hypothetical protein
LHNRNLNQISSRVVPDRVIQSHHEHHSNGGILPVL